MPFGKSSNPTMSSFLNIFVPSLKLCGKINTLFQPIMESTNGIKKPGRDIRTPKNLQATLWSTSTISQTPIPGTMVSSHSKPSKNTISPPSNELWKGLIMPWLSLGFISWPKYQRERVFFIVIQFTYGMEASFSHINTFKMFWKFGNNQNTCV